MARKFKYHLDICCVLYFQEVGFSYHCCFSIFHILEHKPNICLGLSSNFWYKHKFHHHNLLHFQQLLLQVLWLWLRHIKHIFRTRNGSQQLRLVQDGLLCRLCRLLRHIRWRDVSRQMDDRDPKFHNRSKVQGLVQHWLEQSMPKQSNRKSENCQMAVKIQFFQVLYNKLSLLIS